jgi:hypothetical protein
VYNVHLSWGTEPMHMRLFILYLLAVGCITIVRTMQLVWNLYSLADRKQISSENIRAGTINPDFIAQSALASEQDRVRTRDQSTPRPGHFTARCYWRGVCQTYAFGR